MPLLSLNEIGEKLQPTTTLDNFVHNSQSNYYWLTVFGKYPSLIKTQKTFT